jgi:hypothetical protein
MFIRLFDGDSLEQLINVDHISRIELFYAYRRGEQLMGTSVTEGSADPNAFRVYLFNVDGKAFVVPGDAGDPVSAVLADIYSKAAKASHAYKFP